MWTRCRKMASLLDLCERSILLQSCGFGLSHSVVMWSVHFHTLRFPIPDRKLSCWFSRHHEACRLNEAKKPAQITNGPLGETVLFNSSLGRRNLPKSLSSNTNEEKACWWRPVIPASLESEAEESSSVRHGYRLSSRTACIGSWDFQSKENISGEVWKYRRVVTYIYHVTGPRSNTLYWQTKVNTAK